MSFQCLPPSEITMKGDGSAIVALTRGVAAIIDADDAAEVGQYRWMAQRGGGNGLYAARAQYDYVEGKRHRSLIFLHRLLLSAPRGKVVDHINRNTLDNRRANLRLCSSAENGQNRKLASNNSTGYKGVSFYCNAFVAKIGCKGRVEFLGCFRSAEDAARAYDKAAIEMHRDFATLNFPGEH